MVKKDIRKLTVRNLEKNRQIAETMKATLERHSNMVCKTFEVKIQDNQLSKKQRLPISMMFLESKWYKNYIIRWSEETGNPIWKFDTKTTHIIRKDKDMNDFEYDIQYLPASLRQTLLKRMSENFKTMSTLRKKGKQKNNGKLKYSKEETIIDYKQYGTTHKIVSKNSIKLQGVKGKIRVNGLSQFINIEGIEYANARLIDRPDGYYIQIVCYIPKESNTKQSNGEILGIDFGCETSFTLSTGEKIDAKIQESERLKNLQRKLSRQKKGSKGWFKTVSKIKIEYQKLNNKKKDLTNKTVAKFLEYDVIVIQDEQLSNWHKSGHGKAVQHSILGSVKAKLKSSNKVVIIDKYLPTTKMCNKCGTLNNNIKVWDREFICSNPSCQHHEDRDIHSAENMVLFYINGIYGVERTLTRVERQKICYSVFRTADSDVLSKPEATTL